MSEPQDDAVEALLRRQFESVEVDDSFTRQVMHLVPSGRRPARWPLWLGILAGAAACWFELATSSLLHIGWRDWLGGATSIPAIYVWLASAGMSWLALGWGLMESRDN